MSKENLANKKEIKEMFRYPIMDAIARRRGRRFPQGCSSPEGMMHYVSNKTPTPLNDLETSMLCWAGAGVTGIITGDLPTKYGGNIFGSWVGKATPHPCNVHNTKLFYTNDSGTYLYDPQKATKTVEIETEADWDKIVAYYKESCTKIMDTRVEFVPKMLGGTMSWNINRPGTTVFIPVVDQVEEYINFMISIFEREGFGYRMVDDMKGCSAGLQKWIDSGQLKGPEIPLSSHELNLLYGNIAPAYMILENIHLVAEAMGLGGIMFSGYTGQILLGVTPFSKGLGFSAVTGRDGKPNPVGLDSIFESYCPPFYKNMDEAVDAFFEKKYGSNGIYKADYTGVTPFKNWRGVQPDFNIPSKTSMDQVKAYFNYIYETYGRVPARFDAKLLPVWLQVHHLDIDFYDEHFPPEMVTREQRDHMALWHK